MAQRAQVLQIVKDHGDGLAVRLVDDARAALLHARASVVASGTATFLIMGDACTRGCRFCAVETRPPKVKRKWDQQRIIDYCTTGC